MLTQTFECIKVMSAQYWPNKLGQTEKYGEFSVTLIQEDTFADYKVDSLSNNTIFIDYNSDVCVIIRMFLKYF